MGRLRLGSPMDYIPAWGVLLILSTNGSPTTCMQISYSPVANVKLVQARLGHKSATETLDTYGHLWPDADEQTRNILNEALTGLRQVDSKLRVLKIP